MQELADQLGISLPKAYELTKRPDFPVLRIGTRIIIPTEDLNKWLSEKATKSQKKKMKKEKKERKRKLKIKNNYKNKIKAFYKKFKNMKLLEAKKLL